MSITYDVKVLADSMSPDGVRLTTLQCRYPRFIHSEMLRHRVFSHSVASSRAIPTEKQIERVSTDPFIPETFNKRVKGMGVGEALDAEETEKARHLWIRASQEAVMHATLLNDLGIDKSRANRLLEPFIWVDDIITATEWDNFFALRDHPAAQPEFQILAQIMRAALRTSDPEIIEYGEWHLPYVTDLEQNALREAVGELNTESAAEVWHLWARISAARCARVSFDTHDQFEVASKSLERARMLLSSGHLSPFEHVARPVVSNDMPYDEFNPNTFFGNFQGWVQFRKQISNESNFGALTEEATT